MQVTTHGGCTSMVRDCAESLTLREKSQAMPLKQTRIKCKINARPQGAAEVDTKISPLREHPGCSSRRCWPAED